MKRRLAAMLRAIPDSVLLHRIPDLIGNAIRLCIPLFLTLLALLMAHDVGMRAPYGWPAFLMPVLLAVGALGYAVDRATMRAKTDMANRILRFIATDSESTVTVRHKAVELAEGSLDQIAEQLVRVAREHGWKGPA